MGKGNRGFKPQGMLNPILMARLSRPVQAEVPSRPRLDRESRPSWEEVKRVVVKKQKSTSDFLEQWENDNYREELKTIREKKRGEQEKQYFKKMQRLHHSKREDAKQKRSEDDTMTSEASNGSDTLTPHETVPKHPCKSYFVKNTSPDEHSKQRSHKTRQRGQDEKRSKERHSKHSHKGKSSLNPYKFSNFLHMKTHFD